MADTASYKLSGSTNGRGILVVAINTAGTAIHTATTGEAFFDEIWLWAYNNDSAARVLTIELGGVTSPGDIISKSIPSKDGLTLVIPGARLNNGVAIAAFASAASQITIFGHVNRIIQSAP